MLHQYPNVWGLKHISAPTFDIGGGVSALPPVPTHMHVKINLRSTSDRDLLDG